MADLKEKVKLGVHVSLTCEACGEEILLNVDDSISQAIQTLVNVASEERWIIDDNQVKCFDCTL